MSLFSICFLNFLESSSPSCESLSCSLLLLVLVNCFIVPRSYHGNTEQWFIGFCPSSARCGLRRREIFSPAVLFKLKYHALSTPSNLQFFINNVLSRCFHLQSLRFFDAVCSTICSHICLLLSDDGLACFL